MDFIYKMAIGCVAGFAITMILLRFLPGEKLILGHDRGRKFAQGSEVNIGKPTGVGFYFILVFLIISAIICFIIDPVTSDKGFFESGNAVTGLGLGLIAVLAEMVTGWLDDTSRARLTSQYPSSLPSSACTSSAHASISRSQALILISTPCSSISSR